ncbi:MAG: hypothetical protein QOE38_666 [Thermoleophilaceae bacterium]|nr:hypothetical protein [Thermoleophilaceae bacterium]
MLPERLRRHADSLERSGRSPLYVVLMRSAADDIEAGGVVARLFEGVDVPPGSVPALRLLAALHYLVLSGRVARLDGWPAAEAAFEAHFDEVRERLRQTVQTNDVGRSAVLYAALLWLTERHSMPIRLLEVGASAGLNLLPDRYCYVIDGVKLGDPGSTVRLVEPWERAPDVDLARAAARLRVVERAGCDLAPLNPADPDDRVTIMSYIWPDESERLERTRAALDLAAREPPLVAAEHAAAWLRRIPAAPPGTLTVVWQSLFRQYLTGEDWEALEAAHPEGAVWLRMEPGADHVANAELTIVETPGGRARRLALCGDHGAPVAWCV